MNRKTARAFCPLILGDSAIQSSHRAGLEDLQA